MKAYQIKIAIKHSHPPIWRRCIVPSGLTFSQLGVILNEVMGWSGAHLFQFNFYHMGITIEEEPEEYDWGDEDILDSVDTPIEPFLDHEEWFTYVYDFGDDWEHRVTVEKILWDYEFDYPEVIKYKGDTPYEDCGGIYGYYELLEVLKNPDNPQYEDMTEWVGNIPHEKYDLEQVNQRLQQMRLSDTKHAPMTYWEIFNSLSEGEPLYTIPCEGMEGRVAVREEASLDEWKRLYEIAAELKKQKLWERFWDMDLIALREGDEITFFSVLGRGGECYGISAYEGLKGLNDFMMLLSRKSLNLSEIYAAFSQNNLTCYWGNRDEVSKEQYNIIKSLGYSYRGKNQWQYFVSNKAGYYPYNFDASEVRRMSGYLERLAEAVRYYEENKVSVDFEHGYMYCYSLDEATGQWSGQQEELPFTSCQFLELEVSDKNFVKELREIPKAKLGLDVHIDYIAASVDDEEYERPASVRLCMIADSDTGMLLQADIIPPEEFEGEVLLDTLISWMFRVGRPRAVRVCNEVMASYVEGLCELAGVPLKRVKKISVFNEFLEGLGMRGM